MGQNIPQAFHGDMTQLSPHGIVLVNHSPDWLGVYYRNRVSFAAWQAMADGFEVHSGGLAWRLTSQSCGQMSRVCSCEGLSVKAVDPRAEWSDADEMAGRPTQYPCEIQIQGHAWATGIDPIEVLEQIEAFLGLDGAPRICGRIDLASDFSMSRDQYDHLVCHGSLPAVRANWVSRTRLKALQSEKGEKKLKRAQDGEPFTSKMVGEYHTTLYLGSRGGLQLCIYRKDIDFKGNTGEILRAKWRQAGWEPWGEGVVVRVEVRFSREWIREHTIGRVVGKNAPPEIVLQSAGSLWRLATDQFRLAPEILNGQKKKRMRPTSAIWCVCQRSWDDWECEAELGAVEQVPDINKTIENAGKRIEDLRLYLLPDHFDQVMVALLSGLPQLEEYKRTKSRWRKYAHGKQH